MVGCGIDIKFGGNVEMKVLEVIVVELDVDLEEICVWIEESYKVDEEVVKQVGGLFVLVIECYESCWIDNQLCGCLGCQGDLGCFVFFFLFEDDLMCIFGFECLECVLLGFGMKEGEVIVYFWVNKLFECVQVKVEGCNFDICKQLLKFDDVMNDQCKVIFG